MFRSVFCAAFMRNKRIIIIIAVPESCLIKSLPYILSEKYINISALDSASPGNRHCASCIGTLSFQQLFVAHSGLWICGPESASVMIRLPHLGPPCFVMVMAH